MRIYINDSDCQLKGIAIVSTNKTLQTSLQIFFDSLCPEEKELLSDYMKDHTYESLSKKFDTLLGKNNENK